MWIQSILQTISDDEQNEKRTEFNSKANEQDQWRIK